MSKAWRKSCGCDCLHCWVGLTHRPTAYQVWGAPERGPQMHVLCYISKVTTNTIESTPPTVNSSPYQFTSIGCRCSRGREVTYSRHHRPVWATNCCLRNDARWLRLSFELGSVKFPRSKPHSTYSLYRSVNGLWTYLNDAPVQTVDETVTN